MPSEVQRKLTTILAADAEGYSRFMEVDEVSAIRALRQARGVFERFIARHHGRIANTAGDGLISEFPSVVEAVQCAIEVQRELGTTAEGPDALWFRIGIHLGDVIVDGQDLLGEGVNLAARLQTMAEPGDILISQQVFDQVQGKLAVGFNFIGDRRPRNYSRDVPVYRVTGGGEAMPAARIRPRPAEARAEARPTVPADNGLAERVLSRGRKLGFAWLGLLALDLVTGGPLWAQWPGLVILVVLGLQSAPLFAHGRLTVRRVRTLVIVLALVLANMFSGAERPWAIWPVGAILLYELFRHLRSASR